MTSSMTAGSHKPTRRSVVSADGTLIVYHEYISPAPTSNHGPRPGLIILHNNFDSSRTYTDIAYRLWTSFNIYIPDRRGRGYSGHYQPNPELQTEIDDLKAVLSDTQAQYVLGVGSGAMFAFYTALEVATSDSGLSIQKVAAFEPLVILENDDNFGKLRKTLEQQTDGSSVDTLALHTAKKLTQTDERSWWQRMREKIRPSWLGREKANHTLILDQQRKGLYSMKNLFTPLKQECRMWPDVQRRFKTLLGLMEKNVEVLLIYGSESSHHRKMSPEAINKTLKKAKVVEFGGMGPSGLSNVVEGGEPERAAIELRKFFIGYEEPR